MKTRTKRIISLVILMMILAVTGTIARAAIISSDSFLIKSHTLGGAQVPGGRSTSSSYVMTGAWGGMIGVSSSSSYQLNHGGISGYLTDSPSHHTYTITATADPNIVIDPSGDVDVNAGDDQTFIIQTHPPYQIADVLVDGVSVGPVDPYMFTYTFINVQANHTIHAAYERVHTITASAGANGSINPSGDVDVNAGDDQTFTITPDAGYVVGMVSVDGVLVGAVEIYTFNNVQADHTIHATFIEVSGTQIYLPLILH